MQKMQKTISALTTSEWALVVGMLLSVVLSMWGPAVAQYDHYHAFADRRGLWGLPNAADVLSNVGFALCGLWGMWLLVCRGTEGVSAVRMQLSGVFFTGLLITAVCSSLYHLQPDNHRLLWDRMGMVPTFAGLLGLAVAERVSERAAWPLCASVLLLGCLSVWWWSQTQNLLPWSVVQGGGMLLCVLLALRTPVHGAWGVSLIAVVGIYALAKVLELADHCIFDWTHGLLAGHALKHLVAALAAVPVLCVMHNGAGRSVSSPSTDA